MCKFSIIIVNIQITIVFSLVIQADEISPQPPMGPKKKTEAREIRGYTITQSLTAVLPAPASRGRQQRLAGAQLPGVRRLFR